MAKLEEKSMSKTAFVIIAAIIAFIFFMSPIAGLMAGKVLGAIAIGWPIAGLLLAGLMSMLDNNNYKLNNDLKWKYSFKLDEMSSVIEATTNKLNTSTKFNTKKGNITL